MMVEKLLLRVNVQFIFLQNQKQKVRVIIIFYIYVYKYNQDKSLAISWDVHTFLIDIPFYIIYINGLLDGWLGFL